MQLDGDRGWQNNQYFTRSLEDWSVWYNEVDAYQGNQGTYLTAGLSYDEVMSHPGNRVFKKIETRYWIGDGKLIYVDTRTTFFLPIYNHFL